MNMTSSAPFYLGLPQWHHPSWSQLGLKDLADYSRVFNCVEGNTTFYALPKSETVQRWKSMTTDDFRFCFKFPSTISHQSGLRDCQHAVSEFLNTLTPIHSRLGQLWLQLPSKFGPDSLDALWAFLDSLPAEFCYGVEVRHPAFFSKDIAEKLLLQGLHQRRVNRVIMDSRPVHHSAPLSAATKDAQLKKPKVPVHAILTASNPLIRFIGSESYKENLTWFQQWEQKLTCWYPESSPFLFIHTPDNGASPQLAAMLWDKLRQHIPSLAPLAIWPEQQNLF